MTQMLAAPLDVLAGQEVRVKILSVDMARLKIAMSLKQAEPALELQVAHNFGKDSSMDEEVSAPRKVSWVPDDGVLMGLHCGSEEEISSSHPNVASHLVFPIKYSHLA